MPFDLYTNPSSVRLSSILPRAQLFTLELAMPAVSSHLLPKTRPAKSMCGAPWRSLQQFNDLLDSCTSLACEGELPSAQKVGCAVQCVQPFSTCDVLGDVCEVGASVVHMIMLLPAST